MNNIKKYIIYLYTLKFVKLLSYWSARGLTNKLNQSSKNKYLYYYGFQIFYGAIIKGLLLLLAGFILGILPQILIATLSFCLLRGYIGGLHFDSYTKCAWISLLSLTTIGLLSKYVPYNSLINLCVFMTLLVIIFKYAPVPNKNRPFIDNDDGTYKIGCKECTGYMGEMNFRKHGETLLILSLKNWGL